MGKEKLTANQVSAGIAEGANTKALKRSWGGAFLARLQLLEDGRIDDTVDALKVDPMSKGSHLWHWVQPIMSIGGHIVGAPVATTSREEAHLIGVRTIKGIMSGKKYKANKPEYAIPVIFVLLRMLENHHVTKFSEDALSDFVSVIPVSEESPAEDQLFSEVDIYAKNKMLDALPYGYKGSDFLANVDLVADHSEAEEKAPRWKTIKGIVGCSNKQARHIRKIMVVRYPRKYNKAVTHMLQKTLFQPVRIGRVHPVVEFVEQCWAMRGSSISCSLPKRPTPFVYEILSLNALQGSDAAPTQEDVLVVRRALMSRFEMFEEWAQRLHGGGNPSVWSDTLSKFASAMNPTSHKYNGIEGVTPLASITSFVPGDLAPEMYGSCNATGYFFLGRGLYYCYSANWRMDAVRSLLLELLPESVDRRQSLSFKNKLKHGGISARLAFQGGQELLRAIRNAGITEDEFTEFLRQYYWRGAFLEVNKNALRRDFPELQ